MNQNRFSQILDTRLSRRTALQNAGAIGAAGILASHGLRLARAQDAQDPFEYPDLAIIAVDYAFELPASVEAGWTHVTMDNQGMMEHHAMFLRPNEGSTIEDVQGVLETGDFGALFATATAVGGPNVGPGHQASVAMNLEAGQYLLICAVPNEEGIPHFALGMQAVLEVTEGTGNGTPPEADTTVNLIEMAFEGLPTDATAGTHIWEVADTGTQLHELVILQLAEGVTIDQAIQIFSEPPTAASPVASPVVDQAVASPAAGPPPGPPFAAIGGVAPLSPGESNYAVLDLAAGDYIAICFVPDAETGVPHFAMGMIAGFSVS
jgi:hypothetical protein